MTDPDGQTCRPETLDDGTPIIFRGPGGPIDDETRAALTELAAAARRHHAAVHADDPPVLAAVADAVHAQIRQRGLRGSQLARELGVRHSVVVRLMQHSDTLTVRELTRLARWAGLDVAAVPRDG